MKEYSQEVLLMGSVFTLGLMHRHKSEALALLKKGIEEIERIENLLSEFREGSETSRINRLAYHRPVAIDKECFALIQRCIHLSQLSSGDFDITIGPLKPLYQFHNSDFEMPSDRLIKKTLRRVGYRGLMLDPESLTIRFTKPNMHISFAAIGKGYASDRVRQLWQGEGVESAYINASGDLCAFGHGPDGRSWRIGVAHPDAPDKSIFYLTLNPAAAATSGDYEQHFYYNGRRYSHNLCPHTGRPLEGIKSVTVLSPSAELSDALATAVYVKGVKAGISFLNHLPHTHGILIGANNEVYFTKDLVYETV